MRGRLDGLPAPACLLAYHFVHGHGAVGDSDCAEDDADSVVAAWDVSDGNLQGGLDRALYRVEVFFSRKGARSCSIVGATFWRGLGDVDIHRGLSRLGNFWEKGFGWRGRIDDRHCVLLQSLCSSSVVVTRIPAQYAQSKQRSTNDDHGHFRRAASAPMCANH